MSGYRVLVVDDSSTMRQLISFALRRVPGLSGWDEAADGIEALEKMESTPYALVIADINMPRMSGLQLLDKIRADDRFCATPVVMVTTEGGEEEHKEGFKRGAAAYLPKPVRAPQVVTVVSDLLSRKAQPPEHD